MEIVEFQIEQEGDQHPCSFVISGDAIKTMTVTTPFGELAAGLGGLPPETLARELAEKLARRTGPAQTLGRRFTVISSN